jgi:hypothetical protein
MSAKSVIGSIVGGAIGLLLAIAWIIVLDLVTREAGRGLERVLGEQGLLVASGVVLVVIGAVLVALMLGRRPGRDTGLERWLLGFAGGAAAMIAGVAAIATAY